MVRLPRLLFGAYFLLVFFYAHFYISKIICFGSSPQTISPMQLQTLHKHIFNDFTVFHQIDVAYILSHFSDVGQLNFNQCFTCDEDFCA